MLFSEDSRKNDADNHAVPILDVFEDCQEANASFIVMPLLHRLDQPPFSDVGDAIDFVSQTLEVCPVSSHRSTTLTLHRVSLTCMK